MSASVLRMCGACDLQRRDVARPVGLRVTQSLAIVSLFAPTAADAQASG
jgi:hypothetical protein